MLLPASQHTKHLMNLTNEVIDNNSIIKIKIRTKTSTLIKTAITTTTVLLFLDTMDMDPTLLTAIMTRTGAIIRAILIQMQEVIVVDLGLDSSTMNGMRVDCHKWLALQSVWVGVHLRLYHYRFLLIALNHMAMGLHQVSVLLLVMVILRMEVVLRRQGTIIIIVVVPVTGRGLYRNHHTTKTKTKIIISIIKTTIIISITISATGIGIIVEE